MEQDVKVPSAYASRQLRQIQGTERRFQNRSEERAAVAEAVGQRKVTDANPPEAIDARLRQMGYGGLGSLGGESPETVEITGGLGGFEFGGPLDFFPMESGRSVDGGASPGSVPPSLGPAAPISTRGTTEKVTLERMLGENDLMPIAYLLLGQQRARSVGRIRIRNHLGQHIGFGTGFLVSPSLLLTNNHVLESEQEAAFSEIEFDFEVDLAGQVRQTVSFQLDPTLFFLTDSMLDFTLVGVKPNSDRQREPQEWGWNRLPEGGGLIVKGESVSIIQHPNGEAKQIALRENRVIDLLDRFAHYATDTAPGSSGSPVFNDQWEVVALHHSGVPARNSEGKILSVTGNIWEPGMGDHRIKWVANEGVFCSEIVEFLKRANLAGGQKQLRAEMLSVTPPTPTGWIVPDLGRADPPPRIPTLASHPLRILTDPMTTQLPPDVAPWSHAAGPTDTRQVTWTIPIHITIQLPAGVVPNVGTADAPHQGAKPNT